jgi:hypothetical protein
MLENPHPVRSLPPGAGYPGLLGGIGTGGAGGRGARAGTRNPATRCKFCSVRPTRAGSTLNSHDD